MSASLPMNGAGAAFAELYVLPWELPDATISLYGRGGTRICSLTEIADLKRLPWLDQRLEGYIRCDRLKRTADKTAVVQDKVFGVFIGALAEIEPQVQQLIEAISEGYGLEAPTGSVPLGVAKALCPVFEFFGKLRGKRPVLNKFRLKFLATPMTFKIDKAKRVLGYEPRCSTREGLARTIAWYREQEQA